jgi:DNA-binding IclR family transcriptional regulator
VDATGETCLLALYQPHSHTMSFVARVDSAKALRYRIRMHGEETLAWGASGRSILAFLPPDAVAAVMARAEPSPSSGTRFSAAAVRADLEAIRRAGYARSQEQRIEGAAAISVPVWGADERVIGSLCVTIPEMRYRAADERAIAATLLRESAEISRLWGPRTTFGGGH